MRRAIALSGVPIGRRRRRRRAVDPVVALGAAINVGIYALLALAVFAVLAL